MDEKMGKIDTSSSATRNQDRIKLLEADLAKRKFQDQLRAEVELLSKRQGGEMSSDDKRHYYRTRHLSASNLSEKQIERLNSKLKTVQPGSDQRAVTQISTEINPQPQSINTSNAGQFETEKRPELVALHKIISLYSDGILFNYKNANTRLLKFKEQSRAVEKCSEQIQAEIKNISVTFPFLTDLYDLRDKIPYSEFDELEHMLTTQEEIIIQQVRSIEENIKNVMTNQILMLSCIVKHGTPYGQRNTSGFEIIPTCKGDVEGFEYEEFSKKRNEFDTKVVQITNSGALEDIPCAPRLDTLGHSFKYGRIINPQLVFPEQLILYKLKILYDTMINKAKKNSFEIPAMYRVTRKYHKIKSLYDTLLEYELSGEIDNPANALFALGSIFDELLEDKLYLKNDAAGEFGQSNTPSELVIKMSDFLENKGIKR